MGEAWLAARDLSINMDGWQVLDNFSLDLERGEVLALLGPSGCGKTTFLRILAGLVRPDKGGVYLEGRDITGLPAEKRDFGLMFQDYALFPHLPVLDNVAFPLRQKGFSKKESRDAAQGLLKRFNLGNRARQHPKNLSGGEKQRTALARLLAMNPRLMLLDEPLSAIDSELKSQVMDDLAGILAEAKGAIYVTHDHWEAMAMTGLVALMDEGRLAAKGLWRELWENPPDARLARILGYNEIKSPAPEDPPRFLSPFAARPAEEGQGGLILELMVTRSHFTPSAVKVAGLGPRGEKWRFDLKLESPPKPGQVIRLAAPPSALKRCPQTPGLFERNIIPARERT